MSGRTWFLACSLVLALVPGWAGTACGQPASDLEAARRLQAQERWAASESLATAALTRLEGEGAPDSLAVADALYLLGIARWRTVGYADGSGLRAATRALGIRARRLGPDHLDLADAHSLVARFLPEIGRADSAKIHVRRAIDIRAARLAADDTLIAKTWDQLALIQRNSQDFRGALESWNHAIEVRQRAHGAEHPEVARLLAQTGVSWMELGDLDKARAILEGSLGMFARTAGPDHPGRWIPLNILADVEKRSGNRARNIDLLQEALRVVRLQFGENSREGLTLRSNLAIALHDLDDWEGAKTVLTPLLPLVQAQYGPTHVRTLSVLHGLAICHVDAGDLASGMRLLREEESILAARENPPLGSLSMVRSQIADLLYREGRDPESRAMGDRALATANSTRPKQGGVLASAYRVLIPTLEAIGDTAALDTARRELLEIDAQYALGTTVLAPVVQFNAGLASHRLGRNGEAWAHALEAERLAREGLQLSLQALPDRRALLLTRQEARYLEMVLDLARGPDAGRREIAWDRLVRNRGLVRAEITRRRQPHGPEGDTVMAGLHERWMSAQRRLAQRLVGVGGAPRDSAGRFALEGLRAAAEESEGAYAQALASRGSTVPAGSAGLAEVRARLLPGQALVACFEAKGWRGRRVDFVRDPSTMIAFVARGGSEAIERIELGRSIDLRAALDPWRVRLALSPGPRTRPGDRAERECRRLGERARAITWDRIAPYVAGASDVFLVADGPFLDVPWQALPVGTNGYLVEVGPHLHLLHAERELLEPAAVAPSSSLLAVGAPDYDRGVVDEARATTQVAALVRSAPDPCVDGARLVFGPLPGSGAEAEAVARTWISDPTHQATVLTGAGASEQAFKREARGRAILHLATHGVVTGDRCAEVEPGTRGVGGLEPFAASTRPRPAAKSKLLPATAPRKHSPWMSRRVWLALAGANRASEHQVDENEGILTAEEVLTLDLEGTEWVVLSACHSGLADAWSREGTLGMRRAFDLAGARTVIAGEWAVEDVATREWMEALYAARAGGTPSAAAALESASRTVLAARRKDRRSTHPFYWAAFSASGE